MSVYSGKYSKIMIDHITGKPFVLESGKVAKGGCPGSGQNCYCPTRHCISIVDYPIVEEEDFNRNWDLTKATVGLGGPTICRWVSNLVGYAPLTLRCQVGENYPESHLDRGWYITILNPFPYDRWSMYGEGMPDLYLKCPPMGVYPWVRSGGIDGSGATVSLLNWGACP